MEAVGSQIAPSGPVFYTFGEPARLARAVVFIYRRGALDTAFWDGWFAAIRQPEADGVLGGRLPVGRGPRQAAQLPLLPSRASVRRPCGRGRNGQGPGGPGRSGRPSDHGRLTAADRNHAPSHQDCPLRPDWFALGDVREADVVPEEPTKGSTILIPSRPKTTRAPPSSHPEPTVRDTCP